MYGEIKGQIKRAYTNEDDQSHANVLGSRTIHTQGTVLVSTHLLVTLDRSTSNQSKYFTAIFGTVMGKSIPDLRYFKLGLLYHTCD